MHILKILFELLINLLTRIGDVTIFLTTTLWHILIALTFPFRKLFKSYQLWRRRRKKSKTFSFVGFKLRYFTFGVLFSFCFLFLPLASFIFVRVLPDPTVLAQQQFPQTTKIYDRNHILLYQFYANQNRTLVHLNDIPLYIREATIAIEDKNFYQN